MKPAEQFKGLLEKYRNDPEYIAEGLLIDINEQIVRLLEESGINRTQLAKKLGVSNAYVTKLLNGNENLTIKQLVRVATSLRCNVDIAIISNEFRINRLFSYTPKRVDSEGFDRSISLVKSDDPDFSVAA